MALGPVDIQLQVAEARAKQREQASRDADTIARIREALNRSRSGTPLEVCNAALAEIEGLVNR